MEQFDLCEGISPVVLISVHYMVVVLKDHTSFMYTDSKIMVMSTCVATEVNDLVADDAAAVTPARHRQTVRLDVQVHSMPIMLIHFPFSLDRILLCYNFLI